MRIQPLSIYSQTFPNPQTADDEGLLCYGGDLQPNRVLAAYCKGIFPWFNEDDPILWWSPNPRLIIELDEFKISKSLQKTIQKNTFEIKFDANFRQTMIECATINREDQEGTWINEMMVETYCELFEMGFAHSFESYYEGELVGGGYGLALGNMFCGESMFSKKSNASKVALAHLVKHLKNKEFAFIDCQIPTAHLISMGAKEISRDKFLQLVQKSLENPKEFR
ncbi:MAG: leucyl/phenylalanyl-tRNA--protein transferase [Campylobacterota bacterium]|nr:leucyl/phenylalanyl-tRNA--protein transferase [Campylobacterota bacterium]